MECDLEELLATKNREKTADEMFEELGYEKIRDIKTEVIYRFDKRLMGDRCIHNIMFAKVSKLVFSYGEDIEKNCGFGIKELEVINKKVGELRLEIEIWKDIPSYEGLYQASNLGRIKSLKRYRAYKSTEQKEV